MSYIALRISLFVALLALYFLFLPSSTQAVVNPLSVSNNKFGIHIISPTNDEIDSAKELVNSSGGDWGYITVVIQSGDKNQLKWQQFFDHLRQQHLIPIVRLATKPEGDFWKRPETQDAIDWANFLDSLNWPVKNRYVIAYNEPNHATEWGNTVDAKDYAKTLNQTIEAFKSKSSDFFILNAGLDASAPQKLPAYQEEISFLEQMDQAVPGIFAKLDGWDSHSYPNPGFASPPNITGRGTIHTWQWEQDLLKKLGVKKTLPIFITETGWKHSEGLTPDHTLPDASEVSQYYKTAFESIWNHSDIVAVTPFLLTYQEAPFDHFSFKKIAAQPSDPNVLGTQFYPQFETLRDIPKQNGTPIQEYKAELVKGEIYHGLVEKKTYTIPLTFKNVGQSTWNEYGQVKLFATGSSQDLEISPAQLPKETQVKPGEEYTFNLSIKAPQGGDYQILINLFKDEQIFDNPVLKFGTHVDAPVSLEIKADLEWKKNHSGEFLLNIASTLGKTVLQIFLSSTGQSQLIQNTNLLPEYAYDFTINKPFYKPKTIHQVLHAGTNTLDFGTLSPDVPSAILNPIQLWKLLPFSN